MTRRVTLSRTLFKYRGGRLVRTTYRVCLLPGEGIGPDIAAEAT
ncbi:MAG: hypothetical protein U1E26_06015 [Coriobacteriia bacterium]|nr:hypothetical protein [Coriobacteriia bacterium]